MVWLPAAKPELNLAVAAPPLVLNALWPMLVAPSQKITTPLGLATAVLPGLLIVSVAVKVTPCPACEGLAEKLTTALVLALFTVCVRAVEVLGLKLPSPV